MRVFISWSLLSILLMLTSFMVGCTTTLGDFIPNSRFAFPNSNVEPLGSVTAEVSKTTVFVPKIVDKDFVTEAVNTALAQKGGDLLLNYKLNSSMTTFLFIYTTTLRIDGTAAKMTIGRQELR